MPIQLIDLLPMWPPLSSFSPLDVVTAENYWVHATFLLGV